MFRPAVVLPLLALAALATLPSCRDAAKEAALQARIDTLERQLKDSDEKLKKEELALKEATAAAGKLGAELASKPAMPYQDKLLGALIHADGSAATRADLNPGGLTLLYYSASWCGPCRAITPELAKLVPLFKQMGITPVLVGKDRDLASMQAYMSHMPFPGLPPERQKEFGVDAFASRGIPHVALLDSQGKLIFKGHPAGFINFLNQMH